MADISLPFIIIYPFTIFFQLVLRRTFVDKAMQVNFYTRTVQCFYFIKEVNHPPIVCRPWYIMCDNMLALVIHHLLQKQVVIKNQ